MDRLILPLPQHLAITSFTPEPTTVATAGVKYWISENCPSAIEISDEYSCAIQFPDPLHKLEFKKRFGIGVRPNGEVHMKYTFVTSLQMSENRVRFSKHTKQFPDVGWYYELRYMQGWFKLHVPIGSYSDKVHLIPLRSFRGVSFKTYQKRYQLEELVEIAHELRELYIPAPIQLRNSDYEFLDVTDRDAISIALLR